MFDVCNHVIRLSIYVHNYIRTSTDVMTIYRPFYIAFNFLPDASISPVRIRDDEIGLSSYALTKSTVMTAIGVRPLVRRILLISSPFFAVSVLATRASTSSERITGP